MEGGDKARDGIGRLIRMRMCCLMRVEKSIKKPNVFLFNAQIKPMLDLLDDLTCSICSVMFGFNWDFVWDNFTCYVFLCLSL